MGKLSKKEYAELKNAKRREKYAKRKEMTKERKGVQH